MAPEPGQRSEGCQSLLNVSPEGSLGDNSRNVTSHQMPETLIVITLIVITLIAKVKEGGLEHLEDPNT